MKQTDAAAALGVTKDHLNAVVCGRADAGKKLAVKASGLIGGTVEVWMLEKYRKSRRRVADRFFNGRGKRAAK